MTEEQRARFLELKRKSEDFTISIKEEIELITLLGLHIDEVFGDPSQKSEKQILQKEIQ